MAINQEKAEALIALTAERAERLRDIRYIREGLKNELRLIKTDMNGSYERRVADIDRRIDQLMERRARMTRRRVYGDDLSAHYRDRIEALNAEEAQLSHLHGILKLLKLVKQINDLETD